MKQILIIGFLLTLGLGGCGSTESNTTTARTTTETASNQQGTPPPANTQTTEQKTTGDTMSNPKVLIETSKGNITVELNAEKAPNTTANFISYVKDGFYDGTIFHRIIPGFMVQGGGMKPDMSEKSNKGPIQNEANNGLTNDRGTLAMARTPDPHSASSQFFINVADNDFLNFKNESMQGWGYAVFGKVTDGMDVVDAIVAVKTGNHGGHQNVPVEPVTMDKVTVIE